MRGCQALRIIVALAIGLLMNVNAHAYSNYKPSNVRPLVAPPEDAIYKAGTLCFKTILSGSYESGGVVKCKDVEIALRGDDIYLGGLMVRLPDSEDTVWVKGHMEKGKAIFKSNQPVCIIDFRYENAGPQDPPECTYTYKFCAVDLTNLDPELSPFKENGPLRGEGVFPPRYRMDILTDDLIFDYDSEKIQFSNQNHYFAFSKAETDETFCATGERQPYNGPIAEITHIGILSPDPAPIPLRPHRFKFENANTFRIEANPIGMDGYMLNPENLYYRIYVDGSILNGSSSDSSKPIRFSDSPFIGRIYCKDFKLDSFDECYAVMVHKDGENEYESDLLYLGQSGIEDLGQEEPVKDCQIYDLMGRKVYPENITPGIYIANGKKIMVK